VTGMLGGGAGMSMVDPALLPVRDEDAGATARAAAAGLLVGIGSAIGNGLV
jgi:hypothetical protein